MYAVALISSRARHDYYFGSSDKVVPFAYELAKENHVVINYHKTKYFMAKAVRQKRKLLADEEIVRFFEMS